MFCKYNECAHFFSKLKDETAVGPKSLNRSLIAGVEEECVAAVKLFYKRESRKRALTAANK